MDRSNAVESGSEDTLLINVYCSKCSDDVYRVHTRPTWLPRFLHQYFDRHGEAYPHKLDFADLDRYMATNDAPYEKRWSRHGSVELTARGRSAKVLATWLVTAFSSGRRPQNG